MYADVLIQYDTKSLDKTFTYHVPDNLINELSVGMKVCVPFGSRNINGFVINIKDNNNYNGNIKDIITIINKDFKLNKELLELGKYIKNKTYSTLISAYQTMLPTSLKVTNNKSDYSLKECYISLNKDINTINKYISEHKNAKKQIDILNKLKINKLNSKDINSSIIKKLLDEGLIKREYIEFYRLNHEKNNIYHELNDEQNIVVNSIDLNSNNTYLLYGITGSGKTEVYMHLCESVIKDNKCIIMLVPEISLTTQLVQRFYDRFGNDVAIFHSELSDGEKYDEYKKIDKGEVHIVVGTRSAIFTPIKNLGLIIIDEEHSSSYKQENNPRYNAIDIALWRCKYHNVPLVLGSATPSLEAMARALKGVYKLLTLNKRALNASLPDIKLIDMHLEYQKKNMILSEELQKEIYNTLNKHEQVMLLLNRRGYNTYITCESCGYTYKCPNCDITLTYHKSNNTLRCHYCGYTKVFSKICPNCHEEAINSFGLGTEKLESYINELFPSARVVRMDKDTTSRKGSHERIIKDIEDNKVDIIIGTQMISKGLDFPKVTLVGIINADESLNIPDFRASENTFDLITQVAGRAGRANLKGKVLIQTFNTSNKTLNYVINNDYFGNYKYEMNIRKELKYPPYYYLVSIKILSKDYNKASDEANKIVNYLRNNLNKETIILGPTTAFQYKINNIYRYQIMIKYRYDNNLDKVLNDINQEYITNKYVSIEIDNNPIRM